MTQKSWEFLELACKFMQRASEKNREALMTAASLIAQRLVQGGRLFSFGCGHSGLVAQDVYYRAGGLMDLHCLFAPAVALDVEPPEASSAAERRLDWVAAAEPKGGWRSNDSLVLISTSGLNVGPVELARRAKAAGVALVVVTSVELSAGMAPRHESGLRLFELADVVLDNLVAAGDALVALGPNLRMGSVSTALGALLLQALMIEVRVEAAGLGRELPVYVSGNAPGGMAENARRKGVGD